MGFGLDFWQFIAQEVAFSIFAPWSYVANRHSTLAAILLHITVNLSLDIFTNQAGTLKFSLNTLFMALGAVIIGLVWLRRNWTINSAGSRK